MKNSENDLVLFASFGGLIGPFCFNPLKEGSMKNFKKHEVNKFNHKGGTAMKTLILILGLIFCANIFAQEINEEDNTSLLNAGIGTSVRLGTLLFPSVDAYLSLGPVEVEGYWKYSEYNGDPLHSFGVGTNIFIYRTVDNNRFFLSYDYVLDAETEVVDYDPYKIKKGEGHIFCLGFQGEAPAFFKIGFMYNPTLKDSWDPRIEFGFKFYLNNSSHFSLLHNKWN